VILQKEVELTRISRCSRFSPYLALEKDHNYIRKSVFRISEKSIVFSQNHFPSQLFAPGPSLGKSQKINLVGMMFSPKYDIFAGILRFNPAR